MARKAEEQLVQTVHGLDQLHGVHLVLHNDYRVLQCMDLNLIALLKVADFEYGAREEDRPVK